jgi:AcrR family transcriptional regulator
MTQKPNRLSKETWLKKSLDILADEGETKLTIDHLVKALGVTKGSFYWHFKNRSEYSESLARYWAEEYTSKLLEPLPGEIPDPGERLMIVLMDITKNDMVKYDTAVLNWGRHEPAAQTWIQKAMDARTVFLTTIFSDLGFRGDQLTMRVHTFLTFHTMEMHGYNQLSKDDRFRCAKLRHQMLITK